MASFCSLRVTGGGTLCKCLLFSKSEAVTKVLPPVSQRRLHATLNSSPFKKCTRFASRDGGNLSPAVGRCLSHPKRFPPGSDCGGPVNKAGRWFSCIKESVMSEGEKIKEGEKFQHRREGATVSTGYDSFAWCVGGRVFPCRYLVIEPSTIDRENKDLKHLKENVGLNAFDRTFVCLPTLSCVSSREEHRRMCEHLCTESNSQCIILEWPGLHGDPMINKALQGASRHQVLRAEYEQFSTIGKVVQFDARQIGLRQRFLGPTPTRLEESPTLRISNQVNVSPTALGTGQTEHNGQHEKDMSVASSDLPMSIGESDNLTPDSNEIFSIVPKEIFTDFPIDATAEAWSLAQIHLSFLVQFLYHLTYQWKCPDIVFVCAGQSGTVFLRAMEHLLSQERIGAHVAQAIKASIFVAPILMSPLNYFRWEKASRSETGKPIGRTGPTRGQKTTLQFGYADGDSQHAEDLGDNSQTITEAQTSLNKGSKSNNKGFSSNMQRIQYNRILKLLQGAGWISKKARNMLASEFFLSQVLKRAFVNEPPEEIRKHKEFALARLTFHEVHAGIWCGLVDQFDSDVPHFVNTLRKLFGDQRLAKNSYLLLDGNDCPKDVKTTVEAFKEAKQEPYHGQQVVLEATTIEGSLLLHEEFPEKTAETILEFLTR